MEREIPNCSPIWLTSLLLPSCSKYLEITIATNFHAFATLNEQWIMNVISIV